MEEYEAVKTLTKEIVKKTERNIIYNEHHQNQIIKDAKFTYPLKELIITTYYPEPLKRIGKVASFEKTLDGIMPEESNYVFISTSLTLNNYGAMAMSMAPYAIIDTKEIKTLKRKFYKDDSFLIREAISTLGINDYFQMYFMYSNQDILLIHKFVDSIYKHPEFKLPNYNEDKVKCYSKIETNYDIAYLNSLLSKLNISTRISQSFNKKDLNTITNGLSSNLEFFNFVFEMPQGDQDLDTNKILLKQYMNPKEITGIILREYAQGSSFREYFEILDQFQQKDIVKLIKNWKKRNVEYDNYLFEKGFQEQFLNLDNQVLDLYRNKPPKFIDFFQRRPETEQKLILKQIYNCDFINEEVIEWLNQHKPDLVREVGLFL